MTLTTYRYYQNPSICHHLNQFIHIVASPFCLINYHNKKPILHIIPAMLHRDYAFVLYQRFLNFMRFHSVDIYYYINTIANAFCVVDLLSSLVCVIISMTLHLSRRHSYIRPRLSNITHYYRSGSNHTIATHMKIITHNRAYPNPSIIVYCDSSGYMGSY